MEYFEPQLRLGWINLAATLTAVAVSVALIAVVSLYLRLRGK